MLEDLNPKQREAVIHEDAPLLVIAGAGSGKTRVLTYRIAYLIKVKVVKPENILAVTFTNKAAKEMRERVEQLLNIKSINLWISTFHSISARILRSNNNIELLGFKRDFVIYDEDDQISLIKDCLKELNLSDKVFNPRQVISLISKIKNNTRYYDYDEESLFNEKIQEIKSLYQRRLKESNALDFDDLILFTIKLFNENEDVLEYYRNKFKYIMIDEYQDTNRAQWRLIYQLSQKHKNIFAVGDEDQSIYRWRGAEIWNILNFDKDFPGTKIIKLEQNYRSTKNIISGATYLISNNRGRREKFLWTDNKEGELIEYFRGRDEEDEAKFVAKTIEDIKEKYNISYESFSIFYRTNAQSRVLEEELIKRRIPYTIVGGITFYERKEIKDILAYLKILLNPSDSLSLKRIINFPPRGIGKGSVEKIEEYAKNESIPLYYAILDLVNRDYFHTRIKNALATFLSLIEEFKDKMYEISVAGLIMDIIERSGMLDYFKNEGEEERIENLKELVYAAKKFEEENEDKDLGSFLDRISLISDIDIYNKGDYVSLMTLHNAKGLEFDTVFIVGVEEGFLPHFKSLTDNEEIEEERRLFYVGMTRTKNRLFISNVERRGVFGWHREGIPSRFIKEIPDIYIKRVGISEDSEILFIPGMRIKHPVWGIGTVRLREGNGRDQRIIVHFPDVGYKKIATKYVDLEVI
jgi:DNA helicase-2/ATP-dependent DNA helicase PcrA